MAAAAALSETGLSLSRCSSHSSGFHSQSSDAASLRSEPLCGAGAGGGRGGGGSTGGRLQSVGAAGAGVWGLGAVPWCMATHVCPLLHACPWPTALPPPSLVTPASRRSPSEKRHGNSRSSNCSRCSDSSRHSSRRSSHLGHGRDVALPQPSLFSRWSEYAHWFLRPWMALAFCASLLIHAFLAYIFHYRRLGQTSLA